MDAKTRKVEIRLLNKTLEKPNRGGVPAESSVLVTSIIQSASAVRVGGATAG